MHRNLRHVGSLVVAIMLATTSQAAAQDPPATPTHTALSADTSDSPSPEGQFGWPVRRGNEAFRIPTRRPPVVRAPQPDDDPPAWELAAQGGLWNLMRSGFSGGRVSRNFETWLGAELFVDGRHATDTDPAYGLVGINARFSKRFRTGGGRRGWAFVTAGVGRSQGLGYRYSPLVGAGAQTAWAGPVALRAEVQVFKRGKTINDSARILMGAAIGFGR